MESKSKRKFYDYFVSWLVFSVLIAGIIHILYKIPACNNMFVAVWGAGDILTYISTLVLAWIAYYQNRRFKEESDRYQSDQDKRNVKQAEQFLDLQNKLNENIELLKRIEENKLQPVIYLFNVTDNLKETYHVECKGVSEKTYLRMKNVGETNILEMQCIKYSINGTPYDIIEQKETFSLLTNEVTIIRLPYLASQNQTIDIQLKIKNVLGKWYLIKYRVQINDYKYLGETISTLPL